MLKLWLYKSEKETKGNVGLIKKINIIYKGRTSHDLSFYGLISFVIAHSIVHRMSSRYTGEQAKYYDRREKKIGRENYQSKNIKDN